MVVFMESDMFDEITTWSAIPFKDSNQTGSQAALLGHYANGTACNGLLAEGADPDTEAGGQAEGVLVPFTEGGPIADGSLCGSKGDFKKTVEYLKTWNDGDDDKVCNSLLPDKLDNMTNATKDRYVTFVAEGLAIDPISTPVALIINVSDPNRRGVYRSNQLFGVDDGAKTKLQFACHAGAHFSVVGGEGKADDDDDGLSTPAIAAIGTGAAVVVAAAGYVAYTHMSSGAGVFASSLQ
jgi:hypothetical protein